MFYEIKEIHEYTKHTVEIVVSFILYAFLDVAGIQTQDIQLLRMISDCIFRSNTII